MSNYTESFSKPNHIFELIYNDEKSEKFEQLKEQTKELLSANNSSVAAINSDSATTSISFHGTRMDNIYSILHTGLLAHMNKNSLFGEGTYLCQEPSLSLHYSPSSETWKKSFIGHKMSCLLVCETINDPKHVQISDEKLQNQISSSNIVKPRSSQVPDRYFVVKNNDYVRVKYVLVYAENSKQIT
jgi:poly [ADP-ribose] polymerase 16